MEGTLNGAVDQRLTEGPMDINTLRKVIKMDKEEQAYQKRLMEAFTNSTRR